MDVTCSRCQTEYEFNDALVSERGTTVRCTNCGHQFRVFRPHTSAIPELWRIEQRNGKILELRSLVELQRAIRNGQVTREDQLIRPHASARKLGDIAELSTFFPVISSSHTFPPSSPRSHLQLHVPNQTAPFHSADALKQLQMASNKPSMAAKSLKSTEIKVTKPPPLPHRSSERMSQSELSYLSSSREPITKSSPSVRPLRHEQAAPASPQTFTTSEAPTTQPQRSTNFLQEITINTNAPQAVSEGEAFDVQVDEPITIREKIGSIGKSKRSYTFAIVGGGFALVGFTVIAFATVGRTWVQRAFSRTPATETKPLKNPKIEQELKHGQEARTHGDWATAREAYLRATVLDDTLLEAWDGLCLAESELAISHWVAALVTPTAFETEQAKTMGISAFKTCSHGIEQARLAQQNTTFSEWSARLIRSLVAQNEISQAQAFLSKTSAENMFQSMFLYADALQKKESSSISNLWRQAISQVSLAHIKALFSSGELAFCVYVSASAGNDELFQNSLNELTKKAPQYWLLNTLKQIPIRTKLLGTDAGVPLKVDASVSSALNTVSSTPTASDLSSLDFRTLNERGSNALSKGDLGQAETMYSATLVQHPGDIDALYGLAQVARNRGDRAKAIEQLQKVVAQSPQFLPARLALADEQWVAGQQSEAIRNYEIYLESVHEGPTADRVRARVASVKNPPPQPSVAPSIQVSSAPVSSTSMPPTITPSISPSSSTAASN